MKRYFPNMREKYPTKYGPDGKKVCCACGNPLAKYRTRWCSDACATDAWNHTNWNAIRLSVFARDDGRCKLCDCDLARRFSPYNSDVVRKLSPYQLKQQVVPAHDANGKDLFECDHIIPIVEGGTHEWGNLRTLCRSCHKAETAKLAARRAKSSAKRTKESDA